LRIFLACSLNERGLFDYLLLNDDLDATAAELERVAEVRKGACFAPANADYSFNLHVCLTARAQL
jgi:hypothetical protein